MWRDSDYYAFLRGFWLTRRDYGLLSLRNYGLLSLRNYVLSLRNYALLRGFWLLTRRDCVF
jgi:hypothetical protein